MFSVAKQSLLPVIQSLVRIQFDIDDQTKQHLMQIEQESVIDIICQREERKQVSVGVYAVFMSFLIFVAQVIAIQYSIMINF